MSIASRLARNLNKSGTYRRVFGSDDGKFVLADLIAKYHVLRPTRVVGDKEQSTENEGQRRVVLDILNTLRVDPQTLMDTLEEADSYEI